LKQRRTMKIPEVFSLVYLPNVAKSFLRILKDVKRNPNYYADSPRLKLFKNKTV